MSRDLSWIPIYIGIGSNLDDPVTQVRTALTNLQALPDSRWRCSSALYRNPPMGPPDQPDYVNAVAGLDTRLAPRALLKALQKLERDQGRVRQRGSRWGPRRIDLDILTYGDQTVSSDNLEIPHPGISERNFVLFPLLEVAPELEVPGRGIVRELVANADGTTLKIVTD